MNKYKLVPVEPTPEMIAAPEPDVEPVAWAYQWKNGKDRSWTVTTARWPGSDEWYEYPLYTAPPPAKPAEQEPFTVLVRKHSWLPGQWEAAPCGFPDYGNQWADERINVYTAPQPSTQPPGMAVQALAGEIIDALIADEKDGGYDLTAGLFGSAFSALVRRWANAEWNAPQPAKREPLGYEDLVVIGKQQDPAVVLHHNVLAFARAIEAAHGIGSLSNSGMANTAGDTVAEPDLDNLLRSAKKLLKELDVLREAEIDKEDWMPVNDADDELRDAIAKAEGRS